VFLRGLEATGLDSLGQRVRDFALRQRL